MLQGYLHWTEMYMDTHIPSYTWRESSEFSIQCILYLLSHSTVEETSRGSVLSADILAVMAWEHITLIWLMIYRIE